MRDDPLRPAADDTEITPILLCGGLGTRLWPLSRKSYPKQFALAFDGRSLFQGTAARLSGARDEVSFTPPLVVTGEAFRFIAAEQLAAIGLAPGATVIEPEGRDTAPAILAAALVLARDNPGALALVAPSDHAIRDPDAFAAALRQGVPAARSGRIVVFGVSPDRPETGYGYIEIPENSENTEQACNLIRFVEKPNPENAARMLASGRHLWNAGIFLFLPGDMIDAYRTHAPDMLAAVSRAVETGERTEKPRLLHLAPGPWAEAETISVDYAIMEKARNLAVIPFAAGWSDLGGWEAVWRESGPDAQGVVASGNATAIDCHNSLLRAEATDLQLIGIGLDGITAVAMPDAVLIARTDRTQEVRQAVAALRARGVRQAEALPRDYRPWGWFESLALGERFQVKRIHVHPGAALSLQSHLHRAEHWVVVSGTARVTIGTESRLLGENRSVYIPLGQRHRLENPGRLPLVLIEVQTGAYLGEDDILRHRDRYARGTES